MRHTVRNLFPLALILFAVLLAWLTYSIFGESAVQRVAADEASEKRVLLDRIQSQVEHGYRYGELSWVQENVASLGTERYVLNASLVTVDGIVIASLKREHLGRPLSEILQDGREELRTLRAQMTAALESPLISRVLFSQDSDYIGAVYPVKLVAPDEPSGQFEQGFLWFEKDLRPAKTVALEQVRLQTLALTLGVAFLALCLGVLFHIVVTKRIDKLIHATQRVSDGDLDARVHISSNDEFGVLGQHFNDMLDRRRLVEKSLNQTQKLESIGTLASGIAHDFNNILQAISGYTGLARSNADDPATVTSYLSKIEMGSARAKSLVDRILSFSRASDADFRSLDLQSVLRDSIQLIRSTFPSNIRIRVQIDESSPPVFADATQMQQVITNLCTNALHAMEDSGGELVVRLRERTINEPLQTLTGRLHPSIYVELTVSDSGIGIPQENLDRLLDPFFTTKDPGRGTGLGLSIVHSAVTYARGGLVIDSEPGQGTSVRVLLPRAEADLDSVIVDDLASPVAERAATTLDVLLVDDELAITDSTSLLLEECGCRVHAVNNALDAIDYIMEAPRPIDVAVFDYMMPDMTGVELASRVAELRPDIPVVIASGMLDEDALAELRPHNVVNVVHKPYKTDSLYRKLQQAASTAADKVVA
ncbi:MAG: ATP-binding protein [Pseudomonadota bacterium]